MGGWSRPLLHSHAVCDGGLTSCSSRPSVAPMLPPAPTAPALACAPTPQAAELAYALNRAGVSVLVLAPELRGACQLSELERIR